ncbi:hypothetical protein [Malikia spinosa]|uniref:hypothetical protein n=1 Tax=Malikia spinosa TaxID=86180 RepID=UPI003FA27309
MDFDKNNFDESKYFNEKLNKLAYDDITIKMSTGVIVYLHEIPDEILLAVALGGRWSDAKYEFGGGTLGIVFKWEINRREKLKQSYGSEFREEVIFAMVEAGISRRVAENMTANNSGLMEQAKKFKII